MYRLLVLSLAVLLLIASCGGGGDAPTTQASSTTTTATSTAAPITSTTTSAPATSAVPTTTASPDLPALLIADSGGIHAVGGAAWATELYVGEAVTLAVPDMLGGIVFQQRQSEITGLVWRDDLGRNAFEWAAPGPEPIWRLAGPDHAPDKVVEHDDALMTLVDVVEIEGRPQVLYRLMIGGPGYPEAWVQVLEWLCLFDLMTGETQYLGLIGSYESSMTTMRLGGNVVAVTFDAYADSTGTAVGVVPAAELARSAEYAWLPSLFVEQLDLGPAGDCPEGTTCESWAVATAASDASRISWVESAIADGALTLVTADNDGTELGRTVVGDSATPERSRYIDDDGSTIVVSGGTASDDVAIVADGAVTWLGRPGATASLWRSGIATYTERPVQELPIVLRGDGLDLAEFGVATEDALDALELALGPYSRSSSHFYEYYYWDNLGLQIAVDEYPFYRQDGVEHLVAWGIWQGPISALRTRGGIGLGATYSELTAAHPGEVGEPVHGEECMPEWYVWLNDPGAEITRRMLVVFDASPYKEGRIIGMHAGASEGC